MKLQWYDIAWPWAGAAGALVLLYLLFKTDGLRGDKAKSRWYDPVWLSWAAAAAYLAHNVEEYGIDLRGRLHEFPNTMATMLHTAASPGGLPPNGFFTAVNLSIVWFAAPIAALVSRRHPLVGWSMYGIMIVNALSHLVPVFTGEGYTPGLLTSLILFLPLCGWAAHAGFGPAKRSYPAMLAVIAVSVIAHLILLGSAMLYTQAVIGGAAVVWIQIINGGLLLLNSWLAEKWRNGKLIKPMKT
ncbi:MULTISPECIES: HXXEE domain-containing protein [unclassified Paenibacillus]|uniref:HXXEE domain-containing protein n=1 Tax=unclassified Paenibacillus TaxID=185978 RepID=UPI000953F1A0|nr:MULTISPECIES: HXXEE domain-containing protein [unclassified Paenibacillus]ASS65366.1 HXXEE domain-containing protein [Paenibacillus sp. RUD330]SIQ38608.1 Protein of unknown function with HXXEE motif-containing protein [Paenibacillus sp. RU4X]SIQ60781.1 Protein of unknown function with HXXEE motif-containing protein [Paenibacillus sp. RU4T]